jgi:hypothetical protein
MDDFAVPALNFPLPSATLPSKNVTVPVAADGETVAMKVTDCAKVEILSLDATVIVVGGGLTICVSTALLALQLLSPLYIAVME